MNKKVKIGQNGSVISLTDKHYKAQGGEAAIYVNGGKVYKLYHEPDKKSLPIQKIKELSLIKNPHVIVPQEIVYDEKTGESLGYTANFVDDVEPLLKLFTRTFKQASNISEAQIADLVKKLQFATNDVHSAHCLIVDYNELNVLVKIASELMPWFIDVDSYQTPSFKATAIMDSVRDRRVSSMSNGSLVYKPDVMSDWFSFAILSFWLYTNIHPFRGAHNNYKPKDKQKQMDDGLSVFHPGVRVPPSVNNFNVIPKRHLDWFKDVFLNNNRSVPPVPDGIAPLAVPATIILVKGTNKLDVIQVGAYSEGVISVSQFMGINYVVTNKQVYRDQKNMFDVGKQFKKVLIVPSSDGTMVVASQSGTKVLFNEFATNKQIDSINSSDMFMRNGAIYTITNGRLVENTFTSLNNNVIHKITEIENVSNISAKMYEGCVIQDLLGKKYLTLPYKKGAASSIHIPELDNYRVLEAKSENTITVILAECKGQYDRFILAFDKEYKVFDVRKVEDVPYDVINFTVMSNGLCALLASSTELELFFNNSKVEVLTDPPIDSSMKLFSTDGIYFINGNTIHQLKRK